VKNSTAYNEIFDRTETGIQIAGMDLTEYGREPDMAVGIRKRLAG
jgi:hypothetical protein